MIVSFGNKGTEDVFNGRRTKNASESCPSVLWRVGRRKLDQLDSVARLNELAAPPGNRLEALRGNRRGQHSLRINQQYRICFVWSNAGPTAVEIVDYH